MSEKSAGKIGIDLTVNKKGFIKQLTGLNGFAKKAGGTLAADFEKPLTGLKGLAKKVGATFVAAFATKKIIDFGKEAMSLAQVQQEAETKLETVMKRRMSATDEAVQSIKDYASAQQQIGVVGDEVQLSGAQQLSTFLKSTEALKTLVPAMNNLAVQQNGVNVSAGNMVEIGNLLGKAMQGQTGALSRVGITFSEAEEAALKYGTEEERAAALAKIITNNVGEMNQAIASTPEGQIKQLKNNFGDMMEVIGMGLQNLFIPLLKYINLAVAKLSTLAKAFKSFTELITGNKSSGMGTMGADAQNASAGLGDAADSAGSLADNTSAAGDAAKKAAKDMKALMGFDEINTIGSKDEESDTENASTPSMGSGIDYGSLAQGETVLDGLDSKMSGLIGRFKELAGLFKKGFDNGFGKTDFDGLIKECKRAGQAIKDIFTDPKIIASAKTMTDKLAETLGTVTGSAFKIAVKWGEAIVGGIADSLESNKQWISDSLSGLFDSWGDIFDQVKETTLELSDIFTSPEILGGVRKLTGSMTTEFMKSAYSAASIGTTIAENLTGGIGKYIDQSKEYIKEKLAGIFNVEAEIMDLTGDVRLALADILSVFGGETAQQITADLIGIFSDGFLGVTELALEFGRDIIDTLTTPFTENADVIKEALENTLSPISEILSTLHDSVKKTFERIGAVYDEHIKPMFDAFKEGFSDIVKALFEGYNEHIAPVLDKLAGKFKDVWESHVQPCIDKAVELIGKIAELVKTVWQTVLQPVIKWIAEAIAPAIAPILEWIGNMFGDTFGAIADVIGGVIDTLGGLIDFITGIFQGDWKKAWNGVKSIFGGIWDAFIGIVRNPINTILGFINKLLKGAEGMVNGIASALNNISIDLPGWLQDLTGYSSIGFDIQPWTAPQIDYLAQGGFVEKNTPRLAVIGDNRHQGEIVAPEDKLQEMVDTAVRSAKPGISREELESVLNSAVMRLIASLASVGFNLDGEQLATLQQMAQTGIDRRYNMVNVTI